MHRAATTAVPTLAVLAAILVSSLASATDRFYRDQAVTSPNGRYRLEARSPDNAGEKPKPFARNFRYTLTDTSTNQTLWERAQPSGEGSPIAVLVHDATWVVIRTSGDHLVVLEPVTGEKVLRFSILDAFPEQEQKAFVRWTTAGKMWSGNARWSFLEHEDTVYFVVRTWWDRRVIADLTRAAVVPEPDTALRAACDASDRAFVREQLDGGVERLRASREAKDYEARWNVHTAVHIAGRMRMQEAVSWLRELEQVSDVGSSGGWWDTEGRYQEGEINPFHVTNAGIRRRVHLALRRIGEKPSELPCTWFRAKSSEGLGEFVEVPALPAPRAERVSLVMPGMRPIEVLHAIGAPDYVSTGQMAWEYEMDADPPYTLRVHFADRASVTGTKRITPALWQQGELRYHDVW